MAKAKAAAPKKRVRKAEEPAMLGPGLHAAVIEMKLDTTLRIRTMDGRRFEAVLGDDMDIGLAEECLRTGRVVIACDTERGPAVMGALQTRRPVEVDEDGALVVRAKDVRIGAEKTLAIEAGPFTLRVDKAGVARFEGNRMVIDMSELVRVLASRMELP